MSQDLAPLRILFEKPGFFLTDVHLVVTLDDRVVHDGGFMGGFDHTVPVEPGPHRIGTRLHLTETIYRTRRWDVVVEPTDGPTTVVLRYSRFWGNFSKKLGSA